MMARRLALVVAGAFSVSMLVAGPAQAVCDPHCSPKSNKAGEVRGLNRANAVAGEHGQHGRDNAAAKQDAHKPGGSGVLPPSGSGGTGDTGGTGGTGGTTGGTTDPPQPCVGC